MSTQLNRFIFLLLLAGVVLHPNILHAQDSFPDVPASSPYYNAIQYARSAGIVSGHPDGTFQPNAPVSRAAFTKIIAEATFSDEEIAACDTDTLSFSDVDAEDWFAPYICVVKEHEILQGYADATVRPGNNINLAEAGKIIVAQRIGALQGDPWYRPYAEYLIARSAIPKEIQQIDSLLTRGQMVEMLYRLEENITSLPTQTYANLHQQVHVSTSPSHTMMVNESATASNALATFAGGCFWCMEPPYQEHEGVEDAILGYAGGSAETATYSQVGRGQTQHREAVQVTYDPVKVTYDELLDIYWRQIDPTDAGGQFADRGHEYTTAIYYHTDEQKQRAEASKQALAESGKFSDPIVTEIVPYATFFPAEEYHQDYYKKSADHYERYKQGSGRAEFIEENWAKTAALEYADEQEAKQKYALTEAEIAARRQVLDSLSHNVIVQEGTEPPFDNDYWNNKEKGIYVDKVSGEPLYASVHKFDSGTGWPSFWRAIDDMFVEEKDDRKLFVKRTEVRSAFADSHLGHIFSDGPAEHGGVRHCINSAALRFVPLADMEAEGYGRYLELFE